MRDHAVFFLNGQRCEVRGAELLLPLSTWLRESRQLTGTKIVCAEGDCGACTVLVGRQEDSQDAQLAYRSIDSCIAFVYQLDRSHVVTIEGLREEDGALSAVQRAMVDCHGSQCGFCTPGFVASIHAAHERPETVRLTVDRGAHAHAGGSANVCGSATATATAETIDWPHALSGNLCRCTGYVQIFDAARAVDATSFARLNDRHPPQPMLADFAATAAEALDASFENDGQLCRVFAPRTLADAAAFRAANPACRLAAGTTDLGVQHRHGRYEPELVLALHAIPELQRIERETGPNGAEQIRFGAATSWTRVAETIREELPAYHAVLMRFGSPQIRNAGTLGGNLANGSPIADSLPLHLALDAELELVAGDGTRRRLPLTRFYTGYKQLDLRDDELIAAVRLPLPTAAERLSLHKVSRRRDMDISTFTAAVVLGFESPEAAGREGATIHKARIAFGGVAATVVRLPRVEAFLRGSSFTEETLREAGRIARGEVTPLSDVRGSADFRRSLCENVLVKTFHEIAEATAVQSDGAA